MKTKIAIFKFFVTLKDAGKQFTNKIKRMPSILSIRGWRFFFYANERNEPPHVHARKGDADCKYWLRSDTYEIEEDHAYNMSPADRRNVRKIIFDHFEHLLSEYESFHKGVE